MHLIFDGTQQGDAANVVVEVLQTFVKCSVSKDCRRLTRITDNCWIIANLKKCVLRWKYVAVEAFVSHNGVMATTGQLGRL